MKGKLFVVFIFWACVAFGQQMDTVNIEEIKIVSSIKTDESLQKMTSFVNTYNQQYINNHNVKDFKDFSSYTPSLFIPDYGSKVTSSIYLRGLGSRIDNSSVGICLDGVMLLNKNCFDFGYFDLSKVNIYKGAQSLTFGMNTMAGVISLTTLSPFDYKGIKLSTGIASGSTYNAALSYYGSINGHTAYMAGIDMGSSQGYFDNAYDNSDCDWQRTANGRLIFEYRKGNVTAKNSTYLSFIHMGGYPYSLYDTFSHSHGKVNYNDFSGYDRLNLINTTSYIYSSHGKYIFQSLTSVQLNFDKLQLDNDFTSLSYFTLEQKEKDFALSQEFIITDDNRTDNWNWTAGAFVFGKYLNMQAPVLFKQDGIQALILDNANNGLHVMFPSYDIEFKETSMKVTDNFKYPRFGGALYAQADYTLKRWIFSLGARLDYEHVSLDYDNYAQVNYRLVPIMTQYRFLPVSFKGSASEDYLQFLPKLAVSFNLNQRKDNIYASISKGYMTGGYNTSMFADIIRNQMMQNMLADLGIEPQQGTSMEDIYASYGKENIIGYKPQYIWDWEIGTKLNFFDNRLNVNAAVFYIDVRNQQLTVFPSPQTTGRMMTNAAKSRSFGTELSANMRINDFIVNVNYGYTNAKFTSYNDGKSEYKGNFLVYYPVNTLSVMADYVLHLDNRYLDNINFSVSYNGAGNIYFNQQNTVYQKYYSLVNADITLKRSIYAVSLWVRNIFNTDYLTFYFLSSGNNFVQCGKPLTFGLTFRVNR